MNENIYDGNAGSYNATAKEMFITSGRNTICLISSAVELIIDLNEQFVRWY